ncbi:MAG: glutaredoxin family protein [Patescibacteria group bacterium]
MKHVKIYSTPSCTYCNLAKEFMKSQGIAYTEIDVAADPVKRKEMIDLTGQMGVPVLDIEGDIMVGYDEERLKELLAV